MNNWKRLYFSTIFIVITVIFFAGCSGGGGDSSGGTTADTTAPTTPTNLNATAASSSQINLSWNAATDNVGVTGYKIYRNGIYLKSFTGLTASDTGLSSSTTYCYTVSACDAANNESSQSTQACASTPGYSISGTVTSVGTALQGVTMTLSGASSMSATTNASGNYTFDGLANGSYTVTPSKTGYTFTPVSTSIDISSSDSSNNNFNAFEIYSYYIKWGSPGSSNGQFNQPYGVAIDSVGNVYVADFANWRIQKFDSSGQFIATWGGTYGSGDGQFHATYSIAVDDMDNVYVYDTNPRIQKFKSDGTFITKWGSYGTGDGQFSARAVTIAYSKFNGYLYITDYDNHRVQVFTKDGGYVSQWGTLGTSDGQFQYPQGIAIDSSGNVYVGDLGNNRVQKFSSTGTFISKWGSLGNEDGQFNFPCEIAIDASDMVYVVDYSLNRVQKFTSSGSFVTKWGGIGSTDGLLNQPYGIAVNGTTGYVYVADTVNNRIQVFKR